MLTTAVALMKQFIPLIVLKILNIKKINHFYPKCFIINLLTFLLKNQFQA